MLKKKIIAQVSQGIATGMTFQQVAQQLAGYTNVGYNNAVRIARTEGHRIQIQSAMDACYKAKDKGADVVKQWDSTLDGKTRPSHQKVDGEIRELDEKFSNGLMFPGDPDGEAAEVICCRCALLQRARWNLDGEFSKYDNFSGELKRFENNEAYKTFKKDYFSKENVKYMKYAEQLEKKYETKDFNKILAQMTDEEYKHFKKLEKERPTFEGMYQGQDVIRIKATDYAEFKVEYLKAVKGLGTKANSDGVPKHEAPVLLKLIDYSDKKTVFRELKKYERDAIKESIEAACVITTTGEVFKCFGVEDRVFPDYDLRDKLKGASVSHNHPIEETAYTFSNDDLTLFMEYNLEVLRGVDEKYVYEFSRDKAQIDVEPEDWMNFENFEHSRMIEKAKVMGIRYGRWINE